MFFKSKGEEKPRVALHVMSPRRDTAVMYVLGNILEYLGCSVRLVSLGSYHRVLKNWRPHAYVHVTPSKMLAAINEFPEPHYFLMSAEGAESTAKSLDDYLFKDPAVRGRIKRVYAWGKTTKELTLESFKGTPAEDEIRSILRLSGYPRADIAHTMPKVSGHKAESIGLLTHFITLNSFTTRSPLYYTLGRQDNWDEFLIEFHNYVCFQELIRRLVESTPYNISIRCHPLEDKSTYGILREIDESSCVDPLFHGRVEIDDSLDFTAWASKQRVIISSDSSAYLDARIMGVPFINMDKASGNIERITNRDPLFCDRAMSCFLPPSIDDIVEAVKNPALVRYDDQLFGRIAEDVHNLGESGKMLCAIAKDVADELFRERHGHPQRMPTALLDLITAVEFYIGRFKSSSHAQSNFHPGWHTVDPVYDRISRKLVEDNFR